MAGRFSEYSTRITIKEGASRENPETTTSSGLAINVEEILDFEEARKDLLPLIKHESWVKRAKECLSRANVEGESVFFRPINRTCRVEFGFTVAMLTDDGHYHYVLNSYLHEWHISEATLIQLALDNLRKRINEEGERIWQKSETGIHFVQGLDALTASVILLPDVIEILDIEEGGPVAVLPSPDMIIIGASQNAKHLCIMGEVTMKLAKKNENFLSTQPIRLYDKQWRAYEPNKVEGEHPFPRTPDEIKMLKRALKMQRVI